MTTQQTKSITQEKHQDSDGGAQQQWNKHDIMTININNTRTSKQWWWCSLTMKQTQAHDDQHQQHNKGIKKAMTMLNNNKINMMALWLALKTQKKHQEDNSSV